MRFRKNSLLFTQYQIAIVTALLISAILLLKYSWGWLYIAIFVIIGLCIYLFENEFIIISESGIECQKRGSQLWFVQWAEIDYLQEICMFRNKAILIICKKPSQLSEKYYFQLGSKAYAALEQYHVRVQK